MVRSLRFPGSLTCSLATGMLLAFLAPAVAFDSPVASAMATIALLVSVVVDGLPSEAPAEWRGFRMGLPLGFFVRQGGEFPLLAPGAERIVLLAGVVWLVAAVVRHVRRPRPVVA